MNQTGISQYMAKRVSENITHFDMIKAGIKRGTYDQEILRVMETMKLYPRIPMNTRDIYDLLNFDLMDNPVINRHILWAVLSWLANKGNLKRYTLYDPLKNYDETYFEYEPRENN